MIELTIVDISEYLALKMNAPSLSKKENEILKKSGKAYNGKSKEDLYRSLAGYIILDLLLKDKYSSCLHDIRRDVNGKPFFVDESKVLPEFSISHSGEVCIIALNDKKTCNGLNFGVDIEQRRKIMHADKLEIKYLKDVNNYLHTVKPLDADFKFYRLDGTMVLLQNSLINNFSIEKREGKEDFFNKWCILEAVLKADGGGFKNFRYVKSLLNASLISTFDFELNQRKYSCALAVL